MESSPSDDWRNSIADTVEALIRHRHNGAWPATYGEWHGLATRMGVELNRTQHTRYDGVVIEDCIVVRAVGDKWLYLYIVHELSEWLLCQEWEPPFLYPATHINEKHKIARAMEARFQQSRLHNS